MEQITPAPDRQSDSGELWLPVAVPGYEHLYEVSNKGRVRSLRRFTQRGWAGGQVLKQRLNLRGEMHVGLSRDGVVRDRRVHLLVLEAFVGPRPAGMMGLHGPAGRLDNSLGNLRWGTPVENQADRLRDGTSNHGERNTQSRLNEKAVMEIRQRYDAGETQRSLAAVFGVGRMTISDLVRRKSWQHLTD